MDQSIISTLKVISIDGVFPLMVSFEVGDIQETVLVHVDPAKQKVYLPEKYILSLKGQPLEEAILAKINNHLPVDVEIPPEVYEAMEQMKNRQMPEV